MFPKLFPSPKNAKKASVFLASRSLWPSEGVQEGRRAPSPPIHDHRRGHGAAWLLRFSRVTSRGEPSGEQTASLHPRRPERELPQDGAGEPHGWAERPGVAQAVRASGLCRAGEGLVVTCCRHCQPGDHTDCGGADCALFSGRPWQPGGQPKTRMVSDAQKKHLLAIGQSSQFRDSRQ